MSVSSRRNAFGLHVLAFQTIEATIIQTNADLILKFYSFLYQLLWSENYKHFKISSKKYSQQIFYFFYFSPTWDYVICS